MGNYFNTIRLGIGQSRVLHRSRGFVLGITLVLYLLGIGRTAQAQEYQGWLPKAPKVSPSEGVRGFFIKLAVVNVDDAMKRLQQNEGGARVIVQTVQSVSDAAKVQAKTPIADFNFKFDPVKVKATTEVTTSAFILRTDKDINSPFRIGVFSGHYNAGYTPSSNFVSLGYARTW